MQFYKMITRKTPTSRVNHPGNSDGGRVVFFASNVGHFSGGLHALPDIRLFRRMSL